MAKSLHYIIIVSTVVFIFSGCFRAEEKKSNLEKEQNALVQASLILDSINDLDSADLIKIHTRGCVGNCLPFETFSKLLKYENKLKSLGYYTKWEDETHRYIVDKISDKLALHLETEKRKFTLNEDINIKATLMNQSSDTLLINNSFLIGHEEQDDREIYFQIFSSDGKRYDQPKDHQTYILSVPPTQANMQKLNPAESIKNEVQLTSLHQFKECGKFKVVAVYESKPVGNTSGVYQVPAYSDTLEIEIIK